MKFHYDATTDSLYIELSAGPVKESEEVAEDVVLDFDAGGKLTGIDVQHAAEKFDLQHLEINALPGLRRKIA